MRTHRNLIWIHCRKYNQMILHKLRNRKPISEYSSLFHSHFTFFFSLTESVCVCLCLCVAVRLFSTSSSSCFEFLQWVLMFDFSVVAFLPMLCAITNYQMLDKWMRARESPRCDIDWSFLVPCTVQRGKKNPHFELHCLVWTARQADNQNST